MYPNKSLSSFSYGTKIKRILKCKEYFCFLWFVFFLLQLGSIGGPSHRLGWGPCIIRPLNDVRSTMDDISLNDGFLIDVHSIYTLITILTKGAQWGHAQSATNVASQKGAETCIIIMAQTCVKLLSRVYVRFGTFRSGTHCPLNVSSRDVSSRERNRQGTKIQEETIRDTSAYRGNSLWIPLFSGCYL